MKLGAIAKDRISGFTGVITATSEWLNGCYRVLIEPNYCKDDGTPFEGIWVDWNQVDIANPDTKLAKEYRTKIGEQ